MSMIEPAVGAERDASDPSRPDSYRRLADVFHDVLSEQSLDKILDRVADTLAELVPYDTLTIYEYRSADELLVPMLARDPHAEKILNSPTLMGEGLTGWAAQERQPVVTNQAHMDPRAQTVPGTPVEPEAMISIPLIARDSLKGALNIYRLGEDGSFTDEEFELAIRFGDAAALALDNAQSRAALERDAQTDSLTGLYNHRFFHDRLRAELTRVSRFRDSVSLVMIDIDDFKKVNDVYGHGRGDQILIEIADLLRSIVRASDVACRLGGEEFVVIMPSCDAGDALGLASRIAEAAAEKTFDEARPLTLSIGVAQGPEHASNPRDLLACADAAMLTAKSRGKDRIVLYDVEGSASSGAAVGSTDVRSTAHLKLLQSLVGKLNRLIDVREVGTTICSELRTLIDYHSCLVYMRDGDQLYPIATRGELASVLERDPQRLVRAVGDGIIGHVAATGRPLLVPNALESEHGVQVEGTPEVEESIVCVPLTYGTDVVGVVMMSKLGVDQFDDDDVRLLQVLSGHGSVALENARLYEAQRREAESAKALLEFSDAMSRAGSFHDIGQQTARMAARLLEEDQASVWLKSERTGEYRCAAHHGYVGDDTAEPFVRMNLESAAGDAFLGDHKRPFSATSEILAKHFSVPEGAALRNVAVAPLHGVKGWITVRQTDPGAGGFDEDRLRLLAGLSHQASVAMQKALLYRDQKENAEIANALLEFSRDLGSVEDYQSMLDRIAFQAAKMMGSPKTSIWVQERESGELACHAWWGYEGDDAEMIAEFRMPRSIADMFLATETSFVVWPDDVDFLNPPTTSDVELMYAIAPIRIDDVAGCIAVAAPAFGDYEFSERKMRLLSGIAYQTKLAISTARSYETLEKTFLSTVEALANALEAKDEYTSSHARWITDMALDVGRNLDLDVATLKRLELGALFHDIGKIGVPSSILLKAGSLNDEEWEIIKRHPEIGERILAPIDRLADVRPIVRGCHEHFDGSGYPDGLSGEDIPLESRIILVVDAFHAMTSDRAYRKAMPVEEACMRLQWASGAQFDPRVVKAFLRVVNEKLRLIEEVSAG